MVVWVVVIGLVIAPLISVSVFGWPCTDKKQLAWLESELQTSTRSLWILSTKNGYFAKCYTPLGKWYFRDRYGKDVQILWRSKLHYMLNARYNELRPKITGPGLANLGGL